MSNNRKDFSSQSQRSHAREQDDRNSYSRQHRQNQRFASHSFGPENDHYEQAEDRQGFGQGYNPNYFHEDGERTNWLSGPSHRGISPKGYKRSDARIREDVCNCLMHDHYIDASQIEVLVKDSEVTLIGTVPDRQTKRRAEDCAFSVQGVSDVSNELSTRSPTDSETIRNRSSSKSMM